jgi:serine phosphatase RsbU (regulator of sigma subunit)
MCSGIYKNSPGPGDWLILHTDGITEARDEAGNFFGEARLVDFLRREAASSHPPPELDL